MAIPSSGMDRKGCELGFEKDENNSFFYLSGNLKELADHTLGWIFLKSLLPKHQRELIKIELELSSLEK